MATQVMPLPPTSFILSTKTRARGSHAVTGCPDKNFLNAILFEIIDSNGQPNMQYRVDYAITIVFIGILISIPGTQREKLEHTVTISLIRHLVLYINITTTEITF